MAGTPLVPLVKYQTIVRPPTRERQTCLFQNRVHSNRSTTRYRYQEHNVLTKVEENVFRQRRVLKNSHLSSWFEINMSQIKRNEK